LVSPPTRHAIAQTFSDQRPVEQQRRLRPVLTRPCPRTAGRARAPTHPVAAEPALPRPRGSGRHPDPGGRLRCMGNPPALPVPAADQATGRRVIREATRGSGAGTRRGITPRPSVFPAQTTRVRTKVAGIETGREKCHRHRSQGGVAQAGRSPDVDVRIRKTATDGESAQMTGTGRMKAKGGGVPTSSQVTRSHADSSSIRVRNKRLLSACPDLYPLNAPIMPLPSR
jgi:hypothetical protein